jgi:ribosomal protein S18 acetylase RimI-like enzyme
MIRSAAVGDLAALATLMAESPLLRRYRTTRDGALDALTTALADGDELLVAGEPVAALAWLTFAPRMLNGAAYLRLLLVAAEASGRGLGSRLLAAAEASSRARARHLYLLVTSDNAAARRFYERRGYRYVGDLPGLVWSDLDETLYYRTLR